MTRCTGWTYYSQDGRRREMTLPVEEFIRRFLLHILPHRFVRIRYYGLFCQLSSRSAPGALPGPCSMLPPSCLALASDEREDWAALYQRVTGQDPTLCVECGHGHVHRGLKTTALARRPPP